MRLPVNYEGRAEIEIQRSVFLTVLARTDTEDAARDLIAAVRSEFPDARHHCSAFIVEVPGAQPITRSSDDGEPAGTAGMPMLEVLKGSGLTNLTAVVVRWFGGIKLGTGGLVRAYTHAVQAALEEAPRVRAVTQDVFDLALPHATAGRTQSELLTHGVEVLDAAYGNHVTLTLTAPDPAELASLVAALTAGEGTLIPAGTRTVEVPAEPPDGQG